MQWATPEKILTGVVKDMEFPGGIKEIACGISRGLCFWPWNF